MIEDISVIMLHNGITPISQLRYFTTVFPNTGINTTISINSKDASFKKRVF